MDLVELESRWKSLMQVVHPDRFASAPDAQVRAATQMATRVNDAYRLLRNPVERGRLLLRRAGLAVDEVSASRGLPMALLEQQMEWRERLDEQGLSVRDALRLEVEAAYHNAVQAFESQLGAADLPAAQSAWSSMLFLQRFLEDLR